MVRGWATRSSRIIIPLLLLFSGLVVAVSGRNTLSADQADLTDTVVLYDSRAELDSDIDFRKVSEYYGLKWSNVDLSTTQLQDSHFRDEHGNMVQAAYIDAETLRSMSPASLAILRNAVSTEGLKLLVTEITQPNSGVSYLTSGEVTGAQFPPSVASSYFITNEAPEVSRQFSGQTVDTQAGTHDYSLAIASGASRTAVIIDGGSYITNTYPVFARYSEGNGDVFLQSTAINYNLEASRLVDIYYAFRSQGAPTEKYQDFSRIVPLMMFVRYAGGDEAWHADRQYASLTIDDPPLTQPFGDAYTNYFYTDLLARMKSHDFDTTIAFVPYNYQQTQPDVVQLFLDNPGYYSLVVHGDMHSCPEMPASDGSAQLKGIALDALSRMSQLQQATGIPFGNDLVFPCGMFDAESLTALKQTGFEATINDKIQPGDAVAPSSFDYGMYQAELAYSNFATIPRMDVELSTPLHELFIGRPLLVFTHPPFFQNGMDAFNGWADSFNAISGGLEWRSLDYIVRRLYLEKLNDDQSVSAMFYTRDVFLQNNYSAGKTFHLLKKEASDIPITAVTAGGVSVPFTLETGTLRLDVFIPAGQEVEVTLSYAGEPTPTPSPLPSPTATPTPGAAPGATSTGTPTADPTHGAADTSTPTPTATFAWTATQVPTPTETPVPVSTADPTPTSGPGPVGSATPTPTARPAPTSTVAPTATPTPSTPPTPLPVGLLSFRLYLPVVAKTQSGW